MKAINISQHNKKSKRKQLSRYSKYQTLRELLHLIFLVHLHNTFLKKKKKQPRSKSLALKFATVPKIFIKTLQRDVKAF